MRSDQIDWPQRRPILVSFSGLLWLLGLVAFLASTFYPSDLAGYADARGHSRAPRLARLTERYGRHINPVLQAGLPLLLGDKKGLIELAKVAVVTTIATHALKRGLNDVYVDGTRLGERPPPAPGRVPPTYAQTTFNMPSGHSSMASSGAYFVTRRYGWRWALLVIPVMLLTLYARFSLDKHTISAVLSGALLGLLCTALFTTRWRGRGLRRTARTGML